MSKRTFVASLFVLTICFFVLGGIELMQYVEFKNYARTSTASLSRKVVNPESTIVVKGQQMYAYPLVFKSDTGQNIHVSPYVDASMKNELLAGNSIQIMYLSNNPRRIFFTTEEFSPGILWFVLGLVSGAAAMFALRLYRRETA